MVLKPVVNNGISTTVQSTGERGMSVPIASLNMVYLATFTIKSQPNVGKYTWMVWVSIIYRYYIYKYHGISHSPPLKLTYSQRLFFGGKICVNHPTFLRKSGFSSSFSLRKNCASALRSLMWLRPLAAEEGWRLMMVSRPRRRCWPGVGLGAWNCQTKVDHFLGLSCEFLFVFFWGEEGLVLEHV